MSSEFEGSGLGFKGRYKRVIRSASIIKPCEHLILERGLLHRRLIHVHGMEDGSIQYSRIDD